MRNIPHLLLSFSSRQEKLCMKEMTIKEKFQKPAWGRPGYQINKESSESTGCIKTIRPPGHGSLFHFTSTYLDFRKKKTLNKNHSVADARYPCSNEPSQDNQSFTPFQPKKKQQNELHELASQNTFVRSKTVSRIRKPLSIHKKNKNKNKKIKIRDTKVKQKEETRSYCIHNPVSTPTKNKRSH